jgi:hypothetical protein
LVSPFSFRVDGSLAEDVQEGRVAVGMPVMKHGSCIEIGSRLRLWLDSARIYHSPDPPRQPLDPEGVSLARQLLTRGWNAGGFSHIRGGADMLADLRRALANHDTRHGLAISQQLIGFGPGLTPSGDDVLVGCLKGLWLRAGTEPHLHTTLDLWRHSLLPRLQECTTAVGAAFIHHALQGQFAEVLDGAAAALFVPTDPGALAVAMARLLSQGQTSGTDTALGLLLSLEAALNG